MAESSYSSQLLHDAFKRSIHSSVDVPTLVWRVSSSVMGLSRVCHTGHTQIHGGAAESIFLLPGHHWCHSLGHRQRHLLPPVEESASSPRSLSKRQKQHTSVRGLREVVLPAGHYPLLCAWGWQLRQLQPPVMARQGHGEGARLSLGRAMRTMDGPGFRAHDWAVQGCGHLDTGPAPASLGQGLMAPGGWDGVQTMDRVGEALRGEQRQTGLWMPWDK